MLEALIFDVDGTIADTERHGHRVAFNRAFADFGLNWHWTEDEYAQLLTVTGGKERLRYFIDCRHPKIPATPHSLEGFIRELHARKNWHYTALVESGEIPARPGIVRLLKEALDSNLRLAIATTTTLSNVETLLSGSVANDAVDWFEVIGAGDIVVRKKPAPDIYDYVLQRLGIPGRQALAIEDSDNGLKAAISAGIPTVVTANGYTIGQDFAGAALVVNHLGEADQPLHCLAEAPEPGFSLLDVSALRRLHAGWTGRKN